MKRQIVYPGAIPLEVDVLNTNKNAMIALGHVLQDMLGTSTLFSGLGCVPTSPAGMTVNVNPGRAYSLQATDTGAYSSLSADATPVVKQGILLAAQNFACPAPTTAGFSINYLIQGAFQEVDGGSTVLPYYNAANPAQAFSGPNGTGTSNTTFRDNTAQLQLKAGTAATTGTQTTPAVDSGFTGLWVITVAFGAVTITSANISQYPSAPFLSASLLSMIQQNGLYAVATGTANAHVAAFNPPVTTRTDGMVLRYKAPAANTGALTLNDGLGAVAVVGAAHSALQGGETAANGDVWVQWNSSISGGSYVLIDSTGGAAQIAPATQSQHALQLGQATGRLLNIQTFTTAGTSTYTPTTGTKNVRVTVIGAGGSGGGAGTTGAGQVGAASGAGGGGVAQSWLTVAAATGQTITVGAGGAQSSSTGNNGGTSSLGALLSATGGGGGGVGAASTPPFSNAGSTGGVGIGGNIFNGKGSAGGNAIIFSTSNGVPGNGGGSIFSLGTSQLPFATNAGINGSGPGCGGGGALVTPSSSAQLGGSAANGAVIFEEFA